MVINHSKLNIIFMAEEHFVATKRNAKPRYEGYLTSNYNESKTIRQMGWRQKPTH